MKRLYYLDNLRVFLTLLVVVFHTSIAYGAAGSWIYKHFDEHQGVTPTVAVLSIFIAVCQAFFMSLFFFISAYFTPASYDRKGPAKFMKDRLIRLGIPLIVYYFGFGPLTDWFAKFRGTETLATFYTQNVLHFEWTFFGPTWFLETLIYFAIVYGVVRLLRNRRSNSSSESQSERRLTPFPSGAALFVFAVLFAVIAFAVRLIYPTGTGVLELQFGYFPLYLLAMYTGIKAYRNHWLDNIPTTLARIWKRIGIAVIPVWGGRCCSTGYTCQSL